MPGGEKINILSARKTRILLAPLDWGLGHTTRCLPIIKALQASGSLITVACNDDQALLLRSEIPEISLIPLRGYGLRYSRSGWLNVWKIISQIPKILTSIKYEKRWLETIMQEGEFDAIISDNRFGLYHPSAYCIFITHQLRVKVPFSKWIEDRVQKWNYHFINRFNECWVPDNQDAPNLAGELSHPKQLPSPQLKYLGPLSRFGGNENSSIESYDLVVLISGPEPQRTILENLMVSELEKFNGRAALVRGLPGEVIPRNGPDNISFFNHLVTDKLNQLLLKTKFVISRSGYSTVMDIMKLGKKSILIPTPGQSEQEYLGQFLMKEKLCVSFPQRVFSLKKALAQAEDFVYADMNTFKKNKLDIVVQDLMQRLFQETQ